MRAFLLFLLLPIGAMADDCGRSNCSWRHCHRHCPNVRIVTVTNTVTVYVQRELPGVMARNYQLQASHIYRLIYWNLEQRQWQSWAIIERIPQDVSANVVFLHDPRKAPSWLLRDITDPVNPFELPFVVATSHRDVTYVTRARGTIVKVQ